MSVGYKKPFLLPSARTTQISDGHVRQTVDENASAVPLGDEVGLEKGRGALGLHSSDADRRPSP